MGRGGKSRSLPACPPGSRRQGSDDVRVCDVGERQIEFGVILPSDTSPLCRLPVAADPGQ